MEITQLFGKPTIKNVKAVAVMPKEQKLYYKLRGKDSYEYNNPIPLSDLNDVHE